VRLNYVEVQRLALSKRAYKRLVPPEPVKEYLCIGEEALGRLRRDQNALLEEEVLAAVAEENYFLLYSSDEIPQQAASASADLPTSDQASKVLLTSPLAIEALEISAPLTIPTGAASTAGPSTAIAQTSSRAGLAQGSEIPQPAVSDSEELPTSAQASEILLTSRLAPEALESSAPLTISTGAASTAGTTTATAQASSRAALAQGMSYAPLKIPRGAASSSASSTKPPGTPSEPRPRSTQEKLKKPVEKVLDKSERKDQFPAIPTSKAEVEEEIVEEIDEHDDPYFVDPGFFTIPGDGDYLSRFEKEHSVRLKKHPVSSPETKARRALGCMACDNLIGLQASFFCCPACFAVLHDNEVCMSRSVMMFAELTSQDWDDTRNRIVHLALDELCADKGVHVPADGKGAVGIRCKRCKQGFCLDCVQSRLKDSRRAVQQIKQAGTEVLAVQPLESITEPTPVTPVEAGEEVPAFASESLVDIVEAVAESAAVASDPAVTPVVALTESPAVATVEQATESPSVASYSAGASVEAELESLAVAAVEDFIGSPADAPVETAPDSPAECTDSAKVKIFMENNEGRIRIRISKALLLPAAATKRTLEPDAGQRESPAKQRR
jgi:hypothetical protein